ncbi:MAG: VOC family protein [bacterium]
MPEKVLDPAGHICLAVSDFSVTRKFYSGLCDRLGFQTIRDKENSVGWATSEGFGLWFRPARHDTPAYRYFSPGLQHLCLKAESPNMVDEVYKYFLEEKVRVLHPPRKYPEYTQDYYAVFVVEPDGFKLEVAYY